MEQKYDVKNTKEVLVVLCKGFNALKAAKANDGKVDFNDAGLIFPLIPHLGAAVADISMIPKEIKDFSTEEVTELVNLVSVELGEAISPELQNKIEKGLAFIHAGHALYKTF